MDLRSQFPPASTESLGGVCRHIDANLLTATNVTAMFELLSSHFYNVSREVFERDLSFKGSVLLLEEPYSQRLIGFSTQQVIRTSCGARVVFSGDTIVDPAAWGSLAIPRAWGLWMLQLEAQEPTSELYWLLISKGHRTFRFLPTYFKDYAPSIKRTYSSHERELITEVGGVLFGDKLRHNTDNFLVVTHDGSSQRLKEHLLDNRHELANQRHVQFFVGANPDYVHGSELVCIARFTAANMRPFCRRMLGLEANEMKEDAFGDQVAKPI